MIDHTRSLVESGYVGWVAYLRDGSALFGSNPPNAKLLSVATGLDAEPEKPADRNTVEWRDVPHHLVDRLDVFFAPDVYPQQPVVRMDRKPRSRETRFGIMKMGGVAIQAGAGPGEPWSPNDIKGQQRLGLVGFRVGYWNPDAPDLKFCELFEVTRKGITSLGQRLHPCAPKPFGFGIAPEVFGLTAADVPVYAETIGA